MGYRKAEVNFLDAVTLKPGIREALLELAHVLYRAGKLDEAKNQTTDIPLLSTSVFKKIDNLEIWLEDFDAKRFYIPSKTVSEMKRQVAELENPKSGQQQF